MLISSDVAVTSVPPIVNFEVAISPETDTLSLESVIKSVSELCPILYPEILISPASILFDIISAVVLMLFVVDIVPKPLRYFLRLDYRQLQLYFYLCSQWI